MSPTANTGVSILFRGHEKRGVPWLRVTKWVCPHAGKSHACSLLHVVMFTCLTKSCLGFLARGTFVDMRTQTQNGSIGSDMRTIENAPFSNMRHGSRPSNSSWSLLASRPRDCGPAKNRMMNLPGISILRHSTK